LLAAYHFNRLPTYSMFTNLLAAPLTSIWIMPAAIVAMIAMPMGLERWPATVMGEGVKQLDHLARWVATWPGAQVHIQPMSVGLMAAAVFGVIFCCLWRGPARWGGLIPVVAAFIQPELTPIPDLLVDDSGRVVAVSDGHGHMVIRPGRAGRFVRDVWTQRYTAAPTPWPKAGQANIDAGLTCDRAACILARAGRRIVIAIKPNAVRENCGSADMIVTELAVADLCSSGTVIDHGVLQKFGAHAVWLSASAVKVRTALDGDGVRAWTGWSQASRHDH
jgi:competence protein ComEC